VRSAIIAGAAMLVLGVLAVVVVSVQQRRQGTLAAAEATGRNLVRVIEEQTVGSIAAVDVALGGIATTLRLLSARGSGRDAEVHGLLLENVRKLPFLRAIWVLDSAGDIIHDSESLPGRYNLSEREYFRVQRDHPERGLYVYGPILSKHGVWFIGVSRRLSNPDGSFAGVIAAALEPKYLQRFYESIDVGKQGVVALMHLDGTLMARAPAAEGGIGRKFSPAPAVPGDGSAEGLYRAVSPEGVARMYAYRRLAGWPLVVVAGLGEAESLAGWWALARVYALASLAFVLAISWLGYLLLRELQRRSALTRTLALDIAARKRAEAVLDGQGRALEQIALGAPLPRTLELLVRTVEEQAPGMLGSVLLLDADGVHLRHGAAPSLPEAYMRGIDGEPIGPSAGSCGTAAYRREAVIVEDIATDPLWRDYRELAAAHGLRACWSTPILDPERRVLGTFAMYFRTTRRPDEDHLQLVAMATHVAAIAIARAHVEQERARLALEVQQSFSQLRELSRRLMDADEDARRRINRELHDRIGQNLSTLALNLSVIRERIPEDPSPDLVGRIDRAQKLLEATILQMRNVMAELHPLALDDLGLLAALHAYAEPFSASIATPVVVQGDDVAPRLPPPVEMSLFRIAQEALANAAKHAQAERIEVTLANRADLVRLTIADDGVGFDTHRPRVQSWGFNIMHERARAAGLALRIDSGAGRGTRVVVEAKRGSA
jgi:signal transduction histidine kinase